MSDDPFRQIMRDRGLGEAEATADEVVSPSLPADYATRVKALELAVGLGFLDRKEIVRTAAEFLDFLMGLEKV